MECNLSQNVIYLDIQCMDFISLPFLLTSCILFSCQIKRGRQKTLLLVLWCLELGGLLPTTSLTSPWAALALSLLASFLVLSLSTSLLHKALS